MKNICFDIECVRAFNSLSDAPQEIQTAWKNYAKGRFDEFETPDESYKEKAGLFPEFGKIVCVSAMTKEGGVKSFFLDEKVPSLEREKQMLIDWVQYVEDANYFRLIGHRIKSFDIPYVNIRLVANGLKVPASLRTYGQKPWEMVHIDTWECWKGGAFTSSQAASLEVVCSVLGIQSPKADFSGAQVADKYYSNDVDAISEIVKYCERDVLSTALAFTEMVKFGLITI